MTRKGTGISTLEGEFFWQVRDLEPALAFPSLPFGLCTANSDPHLGSEGECDSLLTVIALVKKVSRMQSMPNRRGLECSGRPQCSQLTASGCNVAGLPQVEFLV